MNSDHLLPSKESQNARENGKGFAVSLGFDFRESVQLLSKIPVNRTVGFLRSKKESCSTRRRQRVGTGFLEF